MYSAIMTRTLRALPSARLVVGNGEATTRLAIDARAPRPDAAVQEPAGLGIAVGVRDVLKRALRRAQPAILARRKALGQAHQRRNEEQRSPRNCRTETTAA